MIRLLSRVVRTDEEVMAEHAISLKDKAECLLDEELGDYCLDHLKVLRWVVCRMGQFTNAIDNHLWDEISIHAARIPSVDGGEINGAVREAEILISPFILEDIFQSLAVLCHELAHVAGSYDGTIGQLWNTEGLSMAMFKTILTNMDDEIWEKIHV